MVQAVVTRASFEVRCNRLPGLNRKKNNQAMFCNDPSLALLKEYGYNVFRYPRPDARPLDLLTLSGKDLVRLGPLSDLTDKDGVVLPGITEGKPGINISGKQTAKLDLSLGLTLLDTFVSALGGNAEVKAVYGKARSITFSYEAVVEESVDLTKLDAFLNKLVLRQDLYTINKLLEADAVYVFTRLLKTKKLGVEASAKSNAELSLDVPVIQQMAGGKLHVSGDKDNAGKIYYEGEVAVAFGFQAVRVLYEDGHFRLNPVKPGSVGARAVGPRKAAKADWLVSEAPLVTLTDMPKPMASTAPVSDGGGKVAKGPGGRPDFSSLEIAPPQLLSFKAPPAKASHFLTVPQGAIPEVQTVVYVHGIGNKPLASVLKCQWDRALFNAEMGDRTRMAYWVNRERYRTPLEVDCSAKDTVDDAADSAKGIRGLGPVQGATDGEALEQEIRALTSNPARQQFLRNLSEKMFREVDTTASPQSGGPYHAKVLPLPGFMRRWITEKITRIFLRDVNDFLFCPEQRQRMEQSLLERLEPGGGPFVVIAHSQGSMIAYNVLRQLPKEQFDIRLFLTIGSPLGLQEVQDVFRRWIPGGNLVQPACVRHWVNVADWLDPVSLDCDLSDDYQGNIQNHAWPFLNPDSPLDPHSGTGYLKSKPVQQVIQQTVTKAFTQAVARSIVAKDLIQDLENSPREQRLPVLIQLRDDEQHPVGLPAIRTQVENRVKQMLSEKGHAPEAAEIDCTKRFVAAKLTRSEIERLRTEFEYLQIRRVWRNARKRALIYRSTHTVQAHPANNGYGATGEGIGWAVLDTGICAEHPHFQTYQNVVEQWDCTQNREPFRVSEGESQKFDGNGHGTHVAGIIAGKLAVPLKKGDEPVVFGGMAPRAKLYGFKVLDNQGNGQDSWIIKALDQIAEMNDSSGRLVIHGLNLSLGGNFDPSVYNCGYTPLCQELRRLWQQGVVICLAAGNEGYALLQSAEGELPSNLDLSIGDPANLEEAIAVGSVHKTNPHTYGISFFSSRGPTADGRRKPDVVAPGEQILSAYHAWNPAGKTAADLYIEMSGTSMAAPHVSGLLAAFLSLRREFIGYPDRVKQHLLRHCTDLARDPYIQGWGIPNLVKMLANS